MATKKKDNTLTGVKVTKLEKVSDELYILELDYNPIFIAGQVIRLTVSDEIPPRIYSIASGENELLTKILFDVKEKGILTPLLSNLKKNDTVFVSQPFGEFSSTESHAIWIATGTGIAPFNSMLLSGNSKDKLLIHGGKYLSSFYNNDYIAGVLGDNYIRCCSREEKKGIFNGRVTDFLKNNFNFPENCTYYLCGNAEMIVDVRDILIENKISFNKIIAEIYF